MELVFVDRVVNGAEEYWTFNIDNQDIIVENKNVDLLRDTVTSFNKLGYMLVGFNLMPILKYLNDYGIRFNVTLYDLMFVNRLFIKHSIDDLDNVYKEKNRIERMKILYLNYSDFVEKCYCTYNLFRYYIPSYMMAYYMSLEPVKLNLARLQYIRDDLLDDNEYIENMLRKKGLSKLDMGSVKQWVKSKYNISKISMDDVYDIADRDDDVSLAVEGLTNIKTIQMLNDLLKNNKNEYIYVNYDVIQSIIGRWISDCINFDLDVLDLRDIIYSDQKIIIVDFGNIDLYVIAYVSGDKKLMEELEEDRYIYDDSAEWLNVDYEVAKKFNYAVFFMSNLDKLKNLLARYYVKRSDEQIKEVVKKLHETYPNVKGFYYKTFNIVRDNGYVKSMLGRRRYYEISNINDVKKQYIGAAINTIQMSISDVISAFAATVFRKLNKIRALMFLDDKFIFEVDKSTSDNEIYDFFGSIFDELKKELNVDLLKKVEIKIA